MIAEEEFLALVNELDDLRKETEALKKQHSEMESKIMGVETRIHELVAVLRKVDKQGWEK